MNVKSIIFLLDTRCVITMEQTIENKKDFDTLIRNFDRG